MSPNHHLDQATILAYAAGTLAPAFSVVIGSHVALCAICRAAMRSAQALGGELVSGLPAAAVSAACRTRTMAMLDGATLHRFPAPRHAPSHAPSEIPAPLAALLPATSLAELRWKKMVPGVALFDVAISGQPKGQLMLLRVGPGRAVPEHGHGGEEVTLVLAGAYRDRLGRFARGDVAELDADIEHQPIAEGDLDCICLVAIEKPTRFKSVVARLLQPFVGI